MSYSFEHIPYIVWLCGDGRYGDKNAKDKALDLILKEQTVFVDNGIIRDYENHYDCQILNPDCNEDPLPSIWQYGSIAHAISSEIAAKIINDFKPDFFKGFMLRDINLCDIEEKCRGTHLDNITNEHLLLDFNCLVYKIGCCTDHCYD
jgi:hypothetical protein